MAIEETNIFNRGIMHVSKLGARIFRQNVGFAWQGSKSYRLAKGVVIIYDARPIRIGLCKGSSDGIGWKTVTITPEMVGKNIAVFTAMEAKTTTGKLTPEQLNFLEQVKKAGGFAGIFRNEAEAAAIIEG